MTPIVAAFSLALAAAGPALQAEASAPQAAQAEPPAAVLDDVVVEGVARREAARRFVSRVATAPAGARLGRWNAPVCVSVANIKAPFGQMFADRISEVAAGLGLGVGEPGCTANILLIGTDDGAATADALVEGWRRRFRPPIDNTNMGLSALQTFRTSDAPVRWWLVSLPVSADTGALAARGAGGPPPQIASRNPSRLRSPLRYDLSSATVVIDMSKTSGVLLPALIDYTAMVALAQIDPRSDYSGQPTILNLFNEPEAATGLTDWDLAYLNALYEAEPDRASAASQEAAVATELERRLRVSDDRTAPN